MTSRTALASFTLIWIVGFSALAGPARLAGGRRAAAAPAAAGHTSSFYLPLVYGRPPEFDALAASNFPRFTRFTGKLVQDFSPRTAGINRTFLPGGCQLGTETFENDNLWRAQQYVQSYFDSLGYLTAREKLRDGSETFNVTAVKIGRVYPQVFIEVAAHVDAKSTTPGASDNATGAAAVLELATALQDYDNRYSWRFVTFVGEEHQLLLGREVSLTGSRLHAASIKARGERLKMSLVLDGVGWTEKPGAYTACTWDDGSPQGLSASGLFDRLRLPYRLPVEWRRCTPGGKQVSDHIAYWEQGLPAVLSIGGLPYGEPNYHACGDDMAHVNLVNAFWITQQNLLALLALDKED